MKQTHQQWLSAVSWESVIAINKALCQAQKVDHLVNPASYGATKGLWERAAAQQMNLKDVLDICRQCFEQAPFTFNNGNTFSAIGRTLVEESLKALPPVEAQVVRTTISHYIAGLVGRKELLSVLRHFENSLKPGTVAAPAMAAPSMPQLQPQAARA
jgi:hypothetical protein